MKKNKHMGGSFDDFLKEEKIVLRPPVKRIKYLKEQVKLVKSAKKDLESIRDTFIFLQSKKEAKLTQGMILKIEVIQQYLENLVVQNKTDKSNYVKQIKTICRRKT